LIDPTEDITFISLPHNIDDKIDWLFIIFVFLVVD